MNRDRRILGVVSLVALLFATASARGQERPFLTREVSKSAAASPAPTTAHPPSTDIRCKGKIKHVIDVAYEGLKATAFNWSSTAGGGESGRFDPTPVLSTTVRLPARTCLDAHLSAIVGSRRTYGPSVSAITMFQVTLTPAAASGPARHMIGHYEIPFGLYGPAVALEAEGDVDMLAANFFQGIGTATGDVPPGPYRVDVWWSGGPTGGGGAIGADFVLKLYLR